MLSETLANGLERYRIGPKLRALRLKKQLGLVQLGAHSGLSPGMLSKIERGQMVPTLPTLLRIALVFGVGLEHFFTEPAPSVAVVRKGDRLRLPHPPAGSPFYRFESLDFPAANRLMEAYYAEFEPGPSSPHRHAGAEFIYVLKGRLALTVDEDEVLLDEGDAAYFDSGVPHGYRREGEAACAALVVVAGEDGRRGAPFAQPAES